MDADIPRGEKRAKCIFGNYVERYRDDDSGECAHPVSGGNEGAMRLGESQRDLAAPARMPGDRPIDAANRRGNDDNDTSKVGICYLDPTSRKPKGNTDDEERSIGILHGCNVTTGLDDRPEVGDCGFLPGFARSLQCIMKERGDTLSIRHPHWSDGARKVALGVFLMSQARRVGVVDLVHFLHLAVGGRSYSYDAAGFHIISAVVSEK